MPHFHHFSICNQTQSISNLVIIHQNTKAVALLVGQKCLIFITFQSAIKINQFQIWSLFTKIPRLQPYVLAKNASFSSLFNLQSKSINFKFGHYSPKYQGYSLTFWPKMPHFHHFSICNQNQSISNLVIFTKIPRLQLYDLARNASFSSLFNLQSKSINFKFGHYSPKYQGCSLTFWPKLPHFHHFSICNQNQSISNWVIFHQNKKGYSLTFWPKMPHFHHFSICNQNQSISNLVIIHQNTKAIALRFGQSCLIFITFQSAIKINQFQIWSFFTKIPRLQPYVLAKNASFSSLFNLQSKLINFTFGHYSPKYQGYSLTVWPKMPHFHHFSICNQNQSISNLVIIHQNTKAIALRFGQNCLIFISFQSVIKLNQFQIWSFVTKIPRLQPYFLAKNASFSSLFNLQS